MGNILDEDSFIPSDERSNGSPWRDHLEEYMATMIPDGVEQFTTEGERQTYHFLEKVAKPDDRFICWYLPDIQGKEPDFLLFSGKAGLVVLEVKDWNLAQIREAAPHRFLIDIGGKTEPRSNPLKQAREYVSAMLDKVKTDGRLVSKNPLHHGNPKIPIDCGVVFLGMAAVHRHVHSRGQGND